MISNYRAAGEHLDLREIFFSNKEYYSKLEELKQAHLRTMAELESMYQQKLQLKSLQPIDKTGQRLVAFLTGLCYLCYFIYHLKHNDNF